MNEPSISETDDELKNAFVIPGYYGAEYKVK